MQNCYFGINKGTSILMILGDWVCGCPATVPLAVGALFVFLLKVFYPFEMLVCNFSPFCIFLFGFLLVGKYYVQVVSPDAD